MNSPDMIHLMDSRYLHSMIANVFEGHLNRPVKQVRKVQANENTWNPSKEVKVGLAPKAELKAVLHALFSLVDQKERDTVQAMIKENESLTGAVAELKAQIIEVQSSTYIPQRVEDETYSMRLEQDEWNTKNMDARREIDEVKAEIQRIDAGTKCLLPCITL
jgi:hypothetical protein